MGSVWLGKGFHAMRIVKLPTACFRKVCFEGKKKAQKFSIRSRDDIIHLGLPWGAAGAMEQRSGFSSVIGGNRTKAYAALC